MKQTKKEFLEYLTKTLGDRTDDDALAILENANDSFEVSTGDFTAEKTKLETEWQTKYDSLDKTWRDKYKARFTGGVDDTEEQKKKEKETEQEKEQEKAETIKIEDLFEEVK